MKRSFDTLCRLHRTAVLAGDQMACIALAVEADPWVLPDYLSSASTADRSEAAAGRGDPFTGGDMEAVAFHTAVKMADGVQCTQLDSGGHRRLRTGPADFEELELGGAGTGPPSSGPAAGVSVLYPEHGMDAEKILKVEPGCFTHWVPFDFRRFRHPARAQYENGLYSLNAEHWKQQVRRAKGIVAERERLAEATRLSGNASATNCAAKFP